MKLAKVLIVGVLLAGGLSPLVLDLAIPTAAHADDAAVTGQAFVFGYTGQDQAWPVPSNVRTVFIDAQGAQGGTASSTLGIGGLGGRAQVELNVTPGEVLHIYVGGKGSITSCCGSTLGGFNGGGSSYCSSTCGGSGGGASDVRRGGTALSNREVIAGGGGGRGGGSYVGGAGGGGGLGGDTGQMGAYDGGLGGTGGTQTGGGTGGAGGYSATGGHYDGANGTVGTGGASGISNDPGGGGGGGYYGGGGGGATDGYFGEGGGGGGGGSSYAVTSAVSKSFTDHYRAGDGQVILTVAPAGGFAKPAEFAGGDNGCPVHNTPKPVTTSTGNFWHSFEDFDIAGRGPALHLTRTYNSLAAGVDGPFGWGWSSPYSMSVAIDATTGAATVTQEVGSQVVFAASGGVFTAAPRAEATLVHNTDGTYTYTRRVREIFTFDAGGKLMQIKDLNGYHTDLDYTGGPLHTVTDPEGRQLTFAWSGTHVDHVTDNVGRQVSYTYDGNGDLTLVTDVNASTTDNKAGKTTFIYGSHRMLTMRAPKYFGVTATPAPEITNHYDTSGRVDSQTDEVGQTTTFDYVTVPGSTIVRAPKSTDPNGNVTLDTYSSGVLVSQTLGYGTTKAATWTREYDPITLGCTKVTDPNGHSWSATYDAAGNRTSTTDPLGHQTLTTYNAFNEPATVTDAKHVTTTLTYDATAGNGTAGYNLKKVETPLLDDTNGSTIATQTTTLNYTLPSAGGHAGEVTSVVDAMGKTWTYGHDAYGLVNAVTDPLTHTSSSAFDAVGRQLTQTSARGHEPGANAADFTTIFGHDADGKVTSVTDPLGHVIVSHYDDNRNVDYTRDANTPYNQTNFDYDAANQLLTVTRADVNPTTTLRNDYWPDGSLHHQYDGADQATTYDYDALGRPSAVTDPLTRATTYGYDPAGNLVTKADPGGSCPAWPISYPPTLSPTAKCTVTGYDNADRPTSITYSDPLTPGVTAVVYDDDNQRTSMTDGTGTSTWHWDSLHRLTSQTTGSVPSGVSQSVTYGDLLPDGVTHDLRDQPTKITYPGNAVVTRGYDDAGRLASVADWLGNTTAFAYNADNELITRTFPSATGLTDNLGPYDNAGRLPAITMKAGSTTLASFTYGRTGADQLNSVTSTGVPADNHTYNYTPLNQLKGVDGANHVYDHADNLTNTPDGRTQGYDVANEVTSSTAGTPATLNYGTTDDVPVPAGYDGDHKADRAIYRPSTGLWAIHNSSTGTDTFFTYGGIGGDLPVPADYDGDGKADIAIYRSGVWYVHRSSDGQDSPPVYYGLGGTNPDIPVPADYDGDGKADVGVFRPGVGGWYHSTATGTDVVFFYGLPGDVPLPADYDGDHRADIAVFRPSTGAWYVHRSSDNQDSPVVYYGLTDDKPVPADYDGDGKADIAVWRPDVGGWYRSSSADGDVSLTYWGLHDDKPTPADYDGDGRADVAVWRSATSAVWYVQASTMASFAYDNRGNRISSSPAPGPAHTYTYDQADRLTGADSSTYAYDGDGLRKAKTVAGATTAFTWQQTPGQLPLLLTEGSATSTTKYIYGPGNQILESISPTGTATFFHPDQLGSTRLLTHGATVVGTFTYDAYGRPNGSTGTVRSPFGYAGEYTDAETGFQYLRARYYDPATGQFLSRDPFEPITRSPYGYVEGDPLNKLDSSGLIDCPVHHHDGSCVGSGVLRDIFGLANTSPNDGTGSGVMKVMTSSSATAAAKVGQDIEAGSDHIVVAGSVCYVLCGSVSTQGGTLGVAVGGIGWVDIGPYVGWANKTAECRSESSVGGGGGYAGGVAASQGIGDPSDKEAGVFVGTGAYAGAMKTVLSSAGSECC